MASYKLAFLAIFLTIMVTFCYAGPAGQIALAAARASKIPRAIRASFRNPEIGVARGFGKRALGLNSFKDNGYVWNSRRDDDQNEEIEQDLVQQLIREMPSEGVPLNSIVSVMSEYPLLGRFLLRHFADSNRDGILTQNELMGDEF